VARLSDRILVIRDGRLVREFAGPLADVDVLSDACVGGVRAPEERNLHE